MLVCSTPLLAPRIGLYTTSLVSLTDVLIGWRASDCDAPTHLLRFQINMGNTAPSPTWRASPTWHKQKAFPLPGTVALWVFWKSGEFPCLFQRPRTVLCSPTWDVKQSTTVQKFPEEKMPFVYVTLVTLVTLAMARYSPCLSEYVVRFKSDPLAAFSFRAQRGSDSKIAWNGWVGAQHFCNWTV